MDLLNPDKTLTTADLESLALEYLTTFPIPGVEGRTLDPEDGWATVLHAAVEQTSIHDICDQTINTPCSDRVFEWLATVNPDQFEDAVNGALARQARQMLLKATPRSICLDFVDIHYHGHHHLTKAELCTTTPRDGTTDIFTALGDAPRSGRPPRLSPDQFELTIDADCGETPVTTTHRLERSQLQSLRRRIDEVLR